MKEHYTNLHWGDWTKDTARLRSATRGIWLDCIGEMARLGTDRIESQFDKLPFVLRDTQAAIFLAAIELAEENTATVLLDGKPILEWRATLNAGGITESEWIANHMAKACLIIVCRRRTKELATKQVRAEVGRLGGLAKAGKLPSKEPSKTLDTSGNGIGNGNPVGEPEGVLRSLAVEAHRVFNPKASHASAIVEANVVELCKNHQPEDIRKVFEAVRSKSFDYPPQSPATLTDPSRFDGWLAKSQQRKNSDPNI